MFRMINGDCVLGVLHMHACTHARAKTHSHTHMHDTTHAHTFICPIFRYPWRSTWLEQSITVMSFQGYSKTTVAFDFNWVSKVFPGRALAPELKDDYLTDIWLTWLLEYFPSHTLQKENGDRKMISLPANKQKNNGDITAIIILFSDLWSGSIHSPLYGCINTKHTINTHSMHAHLQYMHTYALSRSPHSHLKSK